MVTATRKMLLVALVLVALAVAFWFVVPRSAVVGLPLGTGSGGNRTSVQPEDHRPNPALPVTSAVPTSASSRVARSAAIDSADARLNGIHLAGQLEALTDESRRDPTLAYALAKALLLCSATDSAYAGLAAEAEGNMKAEAAAGALATMDEHFEKCVGLSGSHDKLMFELAGIGASAGLLEAQLEYQGLAGKYARSDAVLKKPELVAQYASNVRMFTERAAATGHPEGLYRAYELYSEGRFAEADPVRAYRYLIALNQARHDAFSQRLLDRYSKQLSTEQLRAAQSTP